MSFVFYPNVAQGLVDAIYPVHRESHTRRVHIDDCILGILKLFEFPDIRPARQYLPHEFTPVSHSRPLALVRGVGAEDQTFPPFRRGAFYHLIHVSRLNGPLNQPSDARFLARPALPHVLP